MQILCLSMMCAHWLVWRVCDGFTLKCQHVYTVDADSSRLVLLTYYKSVTCQSSWEFPGKCGFYSKT